MVSKPDVHAAYALSSPDAVRALYRDWATSYDADFVAAMGYAYPGFLAALFRDHAREADAPVLDIGCGSGAVAEALRDVCGAALPRIDGLDLSPEMLAVAREKRIYDRLIEADLLARLPVPDASYGALVSAGTFTHGHVGPAALDELIRIARPDALFALGINAQHFEGHGFGAAFTALAECGAITGLSYAERPIYRDAAHEEASAMAIIALFRRAG